MTFGVNTRPFSGREGRWGTCRKLRERLFDELRTNVALRVAETDSMDTFLVSGRGELHLAILIETMRREGYEFQVSRPEVILQKGEDGETLEPFEEVHIEVEQPKRRRGGRNAWARGAGRCWTCTTSNENTVHLQFLAPTRGLLGFRYQFLTATRGCRGDEHDLSRLPADGRRHRRALPPARWSPGSRVSPPPTA